MINLERILDEVNATIGDMLQDMTEGTEEHRTAWGKVLDPRAIPYRFWFNRETLVVPNQYMRTLDYYGGFEYVKDECRTVVGDYTVFSDDTWRVRTVIGALCGQSVDAEMMGDDEE